MKKVLFTSESVTEGHPDKICDKISDAVLDELLRQDPESRVACETCCTTGLVMVMGEITTKAVVDYQKIVRETVREIGYDRAKYGFDCDSCVVSSLWVQRFLRRCFCDGFAMARPISSSALPSLFAPTLCWCSCLRNTDSRQ